MCFIGCAKRTKKAEYELRCSKSIQRIKMVRMAHPMKVAYRQKRLLSQLRLNRHT